MKKDSTHIQACHCEPIGHGNRLNKHLSQPAQPYCHCEQSQKREEVRLLRHFVPRNDMKNIVIRLRNCRSLGHGNRLNKPSRHPEFISGSQRTHLKNKEMLKLVQHDVKLNTALTSPSKGMSKSESRTTTKGNDAFSCERYRLTRGRKNNQNKKSAFTLAEVLITLGIIGIVAAMTLPAIIGNYEKNATITRLKKVYSILSQSLLLAKKDNDEIIYWDFELPSQEFMDKYLSPYFSSIIQKEKSSDATRFSKIYVLPDGTTFYGWMYKLGSPSAHDITTFYQIGVDINGAKKPNQLGRDKFIFYIFPQKSRFYNGGAGDIASMVPSAGLYPDGYGYSRALLLNEGWRGCNKKSTDENPDGGSTTPGAGAFCTALIMLDGWKIAPDYRW